MGDGRPVAPRFDRWMPEFNAWIRSNDLELLTKKPIGPAPGAPAGTTIDSSDAERAISRLALP